MRVAGSNPSDLTRERRWQDAVVWFVPLLFWSYVLAFAAKYTANVPYWDTWEFTELVVGLRPLNFSALWRQHNEHRLVFQALFEAVVGRYAHWNIYAASFASGILIGANSVLVIALAIRSRPSLERTERTLLVIALTLILFSFRAHFFYIYEMLMCWGLLAVAMTAFANRFAVYIRSGRDAGLLAALLVFAMLCSGQGLAFSIFILLVGALALILPGPGLPRSYRWLAIVSLALPAVYFIGYVKPVQHPAVAVPLMQPVRALEYLAVLAGSPFAWQETWAMSIGVVVLALFGAGLIAAVGRRSSQGIWRVVVDYPLIWVNLIMMCSIMVGRMGFGAFQATASHYVPFNALFVATALLLAFDQLKSPVVRKAVLAATIVALVPAWWLCHRNGVQEASARLNGLEIYRTCVLADPSHMTSCDGTRVFPDRVILARRTAILQEHGLAFFADPH